MKRIGGEIVGALSVETRLGDRQKGRGGERDTTKSQEFPAQGQWVIWEHNGDRTRSRGSSAQGKADLTPRAAWDWCQKGKLALIIGSNSPDKGQGIIIVVDSPRRRGGGED